MSLFLQVSFSCSWIIVCRRTSVIPYTFTTLTKLHSWIITGSWQCLRQEYASDGSWLSFSLKVPAVRSVLEYIKYAALSCYIWSVADHQRTSFLGLFIFFILAIELNELDRLNIWEVIFMIYSLGFSLEKVAAMQEHGIKGFVLRLCTPHSSPNTRCQMQCTLQELGLVAWSNSPSVLPECFCRTVSMWPLVRK